MLSSDVPLGFVEIPLSVAPADGSPLTQWYTLQKLPKMKAISGEIEITLKFSGPPNIQRQVSVGNIELEGLDPCFGECPAEYVDAEPNELCILCIAGRGLQAMDGFLFG